MKCSINRNDKGVITEVLNNDGQPSKVYEQLKSNAFIPTVEYAANVALNVIDKFSDEPLVYLDSDKKAFDSMDSLLMGGKRGAITLATQKGDEILRFTTEKGLSRLVADAISEGIITEQKVFDEEGTAMFQGAGEFDSTKRANANVFVNMLAEEGYPHAQSMQDKVIPGKHIESVIVENNDNELEVIAFDQIDNNKVSLASKVETQVLQTINKGTKKSQNISQKRVVELAKANMLAILKALGISTTTLESYKEKYKTKYGQDPSIQAIADLANQVVAFAEGQDTLENVSEETVHVLLEAYSEQASLIEALTEVAETEEYAEFSEQYRELYGKTLEGVELEERVRREVLGKIIAKEVAIGFQTEARATIWQRIMDYLRARFSPSHRTAINKISKEVQDAIQTQDLSKFQYDLSSVDSFFYSAMSDTHKSLQRNILAAKDAIDNLRREEGKSTKNFKLDRLTPDVVENMTAEANLVEAINIIVGVADSKLKEAERLLSNALARGEQLSSEILIPTAHLNKQLMPFMKEFTAALKSIRDTSEIKTKGFQSSINSIIESIENVEKRNSEIVPVINQELIKAPEQILDRELDKLNISEEERQKEKDKLLKGGADISTFGQFLGIISNSNDPALKLLHRIVSGMNTRVRNLFAKESRNFLDKVKGLEKHQTKLLDGDTGYYLGPLDQARHDKERLEKQSFVIERLTGKPKKDVEKLIKSGTYPQELLDDNQYKEYLEDMQNHDSIGRNLPYNKEYYEDRIKQQKQLQTSAVTLQFLSEISRRRADIVSTVRGENNTVRKDLLSPADKKALWQLKKETDEAKKPLNRLGVLRTGLKAVRSAELTLEDIASLPLTDKQKAELPKYKSEMVVLEKGYDLDMLDDEARLSFDLNMLDYFYSLEREEKGNKRPTASEAMVTLLGEYQTRIDEAANDPVRQAEIIKEATDFIQMNNIVGLTDEFYEQTGENPRYTDSVERYIEENPDQYEKERLRAELAEYKTLSREKAWLRKQNKKPNSAFEIDVEGMSDIARKRLLDIEEELFKIRGNIKLPEAYEEPSGVETEDVISDDFFKEVKESGKSEYEVALGHMTSSNARHTTDFYNAINRVIFGNQTTLNRYQLEFVTRARTQGIFNEKDSPQEKLEKLTNAYAKSKMASHMRYRLPVGLNEELNEVYRNPKKVLEYYEGKPGSVLSIKPDYTWTEEVSNESRVNKEYKKQDYFLQLGRRYQNNKFFDLFGINPEEWWNPEAFGRENNDDISTLTPTKNFEEWKLYVELIKTNEQILKNQGLEKTTSKFLRPQVYKTFLEQVTSTSTVQNFATTAKDGWEEFTKVREDEMEYGDRRGAFIEGSSDIPIRKIPRYFTTLVDDPKMLTQDIISATLLSLKSSISYKEKKAAVPDLIAIQNQITKNEYRPTGIGKKSKKVRKEQASNVYKKYTEYMNYMIFGVKQTREMKFNIGGKELDATKMISKAKAYSSWLNLAYNFFVDATGATTALLNTVVDRVTGDYYTSESKNWGNKTAAARVPAHLAGYKDIYQKDELTTLMEVFGMVGAEDRTEYSRNSRFIRVIQATPYIMSKLSNLTFGPSLLYTQLKEMRFYNGNFYTSQQYKTKRLAENPKLDSSTIKKEFKALFNESLYEYMKVTPEGVEAGEKYKAIFGEDNTVFDTALEKTVGRVRTLAMEVDGVLNEEERLAIQRDVLTDVLMQHRGWFAIGLSRRFKKGTYNYTKDRYEEGHYRLAGRTTAKFARSIVGSMGGLMKMAGLEGQPDGTVKEVWTDLSDDEKRNIRRVLLETAIVVMLMVIGLGIDFADDDDEDIEKFAKYIYLRTTSEFVTQNIYGIGASATEIYQSPVPSLKMFEILNPYTWGETFGATSKQTTGEKFGKVAKKYLPLLKRYDQYQDIQNSINTYRYYNTPTLMFLGTSKRPENRDRATNQGKIN
jgi:hypothetical protein